MIFSHYQQNLLYYTKILINIYNNYLQFHKYIHQIYL